MNKIIYSLCAAALLSASFSAAAAMDSTAKKDSTAKSSSKSSSSSSTDWIVMDTNVDGLISRDEFMSYQERTYDGMQKNSSGMYELDSETRASGSVQSGDTDSGLNSDTNIRSNSGGTSGSSDTIIK